VAEEVKHAFERAWQRNKIATWKPELNAHPWPLTCQAADHSPNSPKPTILKQMRKMGSCHSGHAIPAPESKKKKMAKPISHTAANATKIIKKPVVTSPPACP
jgi:hypothetical protein